MQSGRIWQNRFFSCVVENEQYLWAVARYIECNPLKAGLAPRVDEYRWSSAKAHVTGVHDSLLSADAWLFSQDRSAYSEFVCLADDETDNIIRRSTNSGRPFGSASFIDMLEFQLNQTLKPGKPGRPRKKTGECP
jgi:putative transposase